MRRRVTAVARAAHTDRLWPPILAALLMLLLLLALARPALSQLALPPGDAKLGKDFALQACAVCHVVAPEQLAPRRLARQPSFQAIANAEGMNPMKLQAILITPHPIMPNLILTPEEASDVIAYIMTLRRR